MDNWQKWEFSDKGEERLKRICLKLDPKKVSKVWLDLLNYNSSPRPDTCQMEVDVNTKEEEIVEIIKECVKTETVLSEQTFVGISINSLSRILMSVGPLLDEFGFCSFCKFIASWDNDTLTEHSLRLVVLPKLRESKEVSGCVIYSLKELAINKPDQLCRNVIIPLLTEGTSQFTDVDLLSGLFSALPEPQKDFIIRKFINKEDFVETDWLLLHLLVKDLSQNSLLSLLPCVQKFSSKFARSQVFGRFLVNFCKNFEVIGEKDMLREVVENHQTLLKAQAMRFLESV